MKKTITTLAVSIALVCNVFADLASDATTTGDDAALYVLRNPAVTQVQIENSIYLSGVQRGYHGDTMRKFLIAAVREEIKYLNTPHTRE